MSDDARAPAGTVPDDSALRRALARARDGKALDQAEATTLLHCRGQHLARLLGYASRTRDAGLAAAGRAGIITYSRKVFIPLTRLCRDVCAYCTFAKPPKAGEPIYLSRDEVLAIARAGAAAGCTEALFMKNGRYYFTIAEIHLAAIAFYIKFFIKSVRVVSKRSIGFSLPTLLYHFLQYLCHNFRFQFLQRYGIS